MHYHQGTPNSIQDLKHVSEYVDDKPRCGTVLKINAPGIAPLTPEMRNTVLFVKQSMSREYGSNMRNIRLPWLTLKQPSKVLSQEVRPVNSYSCIKPINKMTLLSNQASDIVCRLYSATNI